MPKLFQITLEVNKGSVGRIADQIGETVLDIGWSSYVTYARDSNPSSSEVVKIGTKYDVYRHVIETRIFDNHCFSSKSATIELVNTLKIIKPDIIHLHHLHGYYIHIGVLFEYLKESRIPLVWTFHDCWSFTGHCTHFEYVNCEKWKTQCYNCEQMKEYPKSLFFDRSRLNYIEKKRLFTSVENMTIVPVSNWLESKVKESFLGAYPCTVIKNGIDLNVFYPKGSKKSVLEQYRIQDKFIILGVASAWDTKKGFYEFIKLAGMIDEGKYTIVLVGLPENLIKKLPENVIGIKRTENVQQLADLYSAADVFLNPTFEDSYPTTNLESLACGTPVITYKTGGSIESLNEETGIVTEQGNLNEVIIALDKIFCKGKEFYTHKCREIAVLNFDKNLKFKEYLKIYNKILYKND